MAPNTSASKPASAPSDVDAFLAALDHPFKPEILAVREILLGADPGVSEEIKWNAPSFRTTEHFATFQLRAKDGVQVILHFGAKKRDRPSPRAAIADPEGLLQWLGDDRASVKLRDEAEIDARRAAFTALIREWIAHL